MQMIGIGQFDLATKIFQIIGRNTAFDGRLCADVHKHRGLNGAVGSLKFAAASLSILGNEFKHDRSPPKVPPSDCR